MVRIMIETPSEESTNPFTAIYTEIPTNPPSEKQISCLFVRLNMTLVRTAVKSLGTVTYAI